MSAVDQILQPGPNPVREGARRWWQAAIATLLVGIYLVSWLTYTRLHLPPERYEQLQPGAVVTKLGADFTLISLTQTTALLDKYDGPQSPSADAVWVVAEMSVTRHTLEQYFNCKVFLVAADHRAWEPASLLSVSREADNCPGDEIPLGQAHPIEVLFQVPVDEATQLAGVAVPQGNTGRDPLLTPPR